MAFTEDRDKLDFYQNSKRGKILRAMTINDISYWASDAFVMIIFALFVVNFIDGGTASHVGFAAFGYFLVRALTSIPIGQFFDSHKGYLDELWGLAFTGFVAGSLYILLSQSTQLWQLYIIMLLLGFVSAVNLTSWRVLFYNNIDKQEYAQTVGIYQTAAAVSYALAGALGGVIGEFFGFDTVLFVGGLIMFCGGFIPLMVQQYFRRIVRKRTKQKSEKKKAS